MLCRGSSQGLKEEGVSMTVGRWAMVAGVLVVSQASGCSSTQSRICDQVCDCADCGDEGRDDCLFDLDTLKDDANREKCDADYDDFAQCADERIECDAGGVDLGECDDELADLTECLGAPPTFSSLINVCQQAIDHAAACGAGAPSTVVGCEPDLRCSSICILDASCDALTGADPVGSNTLGSCLNACTPAAPG